MRVKTLRSRAQKQRRTAAASGSGTMDVDQGTICLTFIFAFTCGDASISLRPETKNSGASSRVFQSPLSIDITTAAANSSTAGVKVKGKRKKNAKRKPPMKRKQAGRNLWKPTDFLNIF